jgi:hypothetical protein
MKFFFKEKISAHSLFVTLIVALVVSILCSMMILLFYHQLTAQIEYNTRMKLNRNLRSAIALALADTIYNGGNSYDSIDLFGRNNDSAFIQKENWGLYRIACVEVYQNRMIKRKNFFYGQSPDGYLDGCLYLADHQSSLSISGFAKLEGDAYLPKGGLKPVFIGQKAFAYNELINGTIKNSLDSLPPIDERLMKSITDLINKSKRESEIPDSLIRSFEDSTVILFKKEPIILSDCNLEGHILIISDSSVTIKNNCRLENIIVSAPRIEFESRFRGTVQAIATDSILVKSGCKLIYPSSLVIMKNNINKEQPRIIIDDSCQIQGTILTSSKIKDKNKTVVEIAKKTVVTGLVYCSGYLSLKGIVNGTVLTDYFIYKSFPSVYINYLVDAEINKNALSRYYLAPHLFKNDKASEIIQWLH